MMDTPEAIAERVRHLEMKPRPVTPYKSNNNVYDRISRRLAALESAKFVPLTSPLTSTSWDGDSFSTTAKTLIDLSAVFSAPAGISAVLVRILARDSGSAAAVDSIYFGISPNGNNHEVVIATRLGGKPNDYFNDISGVCPCDVNGDVYFQCVATGAGTMDVYLQIWGYWL